MIWHRYSLFARTALWLSGLWLVLQLFVLAVLWWFVLLPIAHRSTDDLAGLIVLSAQTWAELPPETRPDFESELAVNHQLLIQPAQNEWLEGEDATSPYELMLQAALESRVGYPVTLRENRQERWYWVDLSVGGRIMRVFFPHNFLGTKLPLAFLLVFVAGAGIGLAATLFWVRRITVPLQRLSQAASAFGQGKSPEPLAESGIRELALVAASFNRMMVEVRELLRNRTTLLSGISHDLRTPLARMRLALAMLPAGADPQLVQRMERDLDEMNRLIGSYLEIGRELAQEVPQPLDLGTFLQQLVSQFDADAERVRLECPATMQLKERPLALQRVLGNLIENALRYGAGSMVEMVCEVVGRSLVIRVLDRGPGIPAEQVEAVFRPFHRLEESRNAATGGSGLGLAIVRQLAQANGWQVSLHERQGGGLEARLTVPL